MHWFYDYKVFAFLVMADNLAAEQTSHLKQPEVPHIYLFRALESCQGSEDLRVNILEKRAASTPSLLKAVGNLQAAAKDREGKATGMEELSWNLSSLAEQR